MNFCIIKTNYTSNSSLNFIIWLYYEFYNCFTLLSLSMNLTSENFVDVFLKALNDDRVKEHMYAIFVPIIKLTIDEHMTTVKSTIASLTARVDKLQQEVAKKEVVIQAIKADAQKIKSDGFDQAIAIDSMEEYSRRDSLIINGIKASFAEHSAGTASGETSQTTTKKVCDMLRANLGIDIPSSEISTAHRIKADVGHPPILVRFVRRALRDDIYQQRFKLKDYNSAHSAVDKIFINEDLYGSTKELFKAAWRQRKSPGVQGVWSQNCHVMIKMNDVSTKVKSMDHLNRILRGRADVVTSS